jgi:hypothetical protein
MGENPFDMSGATYVEFFQQLDERIAIPIAVTGLGGTLLAGFSAGVCRHDRRVFRFADCGLRDGGDWVARHHLRQCPN